MRKLSLFDYFLSFETNLNLPLLYYQALSQLDCFLCISDHFSERDYILCQSFDLKNKLAGPVCAKLLNCSLVLGYRESI